MPSAQQSEPKEEDTMTAFITFMVLICACLIGLGTDQAIDNWLTKED